MTDRIAQIIQLEKEAEADLGRASDRNWAAAELISMELAGGTSMRGLAKAIGKSHTHVRYMSRAWELVGQYHEDSARPSFYEIYNSTEVRGDPEADRAPSVPSGRTAGREPEPEPEKENAATWIRRADEALTALATNRAAWDLMTATDHEILATFPGKAESILEDIRRRKARLRAS